MRGIFVTANPSLSCDTTSAFEFHPSDRPMSGRAAITLAATTTTVLGRGASQEAVDCRVLLVISNVKKCISNTFYDVRSTPERPY